MQELMDKLGVNLNVAFYLIFFSLIWVRVSMMATVIPFLFGKPVPKYVVIASAFVLAAFAFPNLVPEHPPALLDDKLALVILYLKEIFYGLAIGTVIGIVFHAFTSVGQMIDNQRGMSIARILIPQLGSQASITGALLFQLGIVIYLSYGGHLVFLDSFFQSFITLPVLGFPVVGVGMFPLIDLFINVTGEVIYIALQMSTPVIIAIFLTDLILGIANRVAPQINVWQLGFTMKGYIGILLLFVSITMVAEKMKDYLIQSNRYADEVIELLQGRVPEDAPQLIETEDGMPKEGPSPPRVHTK
ncbi:MAG: flagellar biosynthetic protein FliR [Deltaproteobacteria bacterium]|jgi:type III secretion protein SpaR/YscT/HrcT|nr:flagellar biosynthetic protein FliR [Deltaproteobacteria bacterium]